MQNDDKITLARGVSGQGYMQKGSFQRMRVTGLVYSHERINKLQAYMTDTPTLHLVEMNFYAGDKE